MRRNGWAVLLTLLLLTVLAHTVPASAQMVAIDSQMHHSLALKADGTVLAWGANDSGQLGDGTNTRRSTPVQVRGPGGNGTLTAVVTIAAGAQHSLALKNDGTVWAWGKNELGQVGDGTTTDRFTPVQVKGPGGNGLLTDVVAIAGGAWHTLALKSNGTVWTWGNNDDGQLGDGTTIGRSTPEQVRGPGGEGFLTDAVAVVAGYAYGLALKNDGTLWGWGDNYVGQLGDVSTADRYTPVQVKGPEGVGHLTGIVAVAAGESHSVAVKGDGSAWAWGNNSVGQLGDGSIGYRFTPGQVKGPEGVGSLVGVVAATGGAWHTLALRSDGTVWAWGDNIVGQLGDGSTTNRWTPVRAFTDPPSSAATPSGGAYPSTVQVRLEASGIFASSPTIYYTTDGTEPTLDSASFVGRGTITIDRPGETVLRFFAVDARGSQEAPHTERYIIDPDPPATTASPAGGTYPLGLTVTLDAEDSIDPNPVIYYTLDGSEPTTSSPSLPGSGDLTLDSPGVTVLSFRAVDAAGNKEPVHVETYTLVQPRAVAQGPNPVPLGEVAHFSFDLDQPATLYVFAADGRLVHKAEVPAGVSTHDWGLEAVDGRPVAAGLYLYRLVLQDGKRLAQERLVVLP